MRDTIEFFIAAAAVHGGIYSPAAHRRLSDNDSDPFTVSSAGGTDSRRSVILSVDVPRSFLDDTAARFPSAVLFERGFHPEAYRRDGCSVLCCGIFSGLSGCRRVLTGAI